jgi:hypothetical protein
MQSQIRFKIKKDGTVESEGVNCTGDLCKVLSKPFEDALGVVTSTQDKPELYVEFESQTQKVSEE